MHCPQCASLLEETKIGRETHILVDRCPVCKGIWFEKDELAYVMIKLMLNKTGLDVRQFSDTESGEAPGAEKKVITCPCCKGKKKMVKASSRRNPKISIDYCKKCAGIWVAPGMCEAVSKSSAFEVKLEAVVKFFRSHFPSVYRLA